MAKGSFPAYYVTLRNAKGVIEDTKDNVPSSGRPDNRDISIRSVVGHDADATEVAVLQVDLGGIHNKIEVLAE